VLTAISTVVTSEEVAAQRAKLAVLLSPMLSKSDRVFFSENVSESVAKTVLKLRVANGKYQISSQSGKIPVTVINKFDKPVVINIKLTPLNSRVQVTNIEGLQVPANSHIQLALPFTAIAPGATTVIAQITNGKGLFIGPAARFYLNINIFDSKVTWFTIGAAILLFIAALTQTVRRIRKGRKEDLVKNQ